jgi:hypothetical protein
VREKRKGPISIAGGFVDSVAATVRRMQRDREPRALAYDPTGYARLIQPEARGHARILEIGEAMVALAASDGGRSAKEAATEEPAARAVKAGGGRADRAKSGRAKPAKARASKPGTARSGGRSAKAAAKPAKRSKTAPKPSRARSARPGEDAKAAPDSGKPRKPRARRASRPKKT